MLAAALLLGACSAQNNATTNETYSDLSVFGDNQENLKSVSAMKFMTTLLDKVALAETAVPVPVPDTANVPAIPWWGIVAIVLASILLIMTGVMYILREYAFVNKNRDINENAGKNQVQTRLIVK